MFPAMKCYDFAMFRKAGGQRGGTGHGRARRRLDTLSTPVLSPSTALRTGVAEAKSKEACRREQLNTYNPRSSQGQALIGDPASFSFLLRSFPTLVIGNPVSFVFVAAPSHGAICCRYVDYKSGLAYTAKVRLL